MEIKLGDVFIETTPSGREVEHRVLELDAPPFNPLADPGPYVIMTDPMRGKPLGMKASDIEEVDWMRAKADEDDDRLTDEEYDRSDGHA